MKMKKVSALLCIFSVVQLYAASADKSENPLKTITVNLGPISHFVQPHSVIEGIEDFSEERRNQILRTSVWAALPVNLGRLGDNNGSIVTKLSVCPGDHYSHSMEKTLELVIPSRTDDLSNEDSLETISCQDLEDLFYRCDRLNTAHEVMVPATAQKVILCLDEGEIPTGDFSIGVGVLDDGSDAGKRVTFVVKRGAWPISEDPRVILKHSSDCFNSRTSERVALHEASPRTRENGAFDLKIIGQRTRTSLSTLEAVTIFPGMPQFFHSITEIQDPSLLVTSVISHEFKGTLGCVPITGPRGDALALFGPQGFTAAVKRRT